MSIWTRSETESNPPIPSHHTPPYLKAFVILNVFSIKGGQEPEGVERVGGGMQGGIDGTIPIGNNPSLFMPHGFTSWHFPYAHWVIITIV